MKRQYIHISSVLLTVVALTAIVGCSSDDKQADGIVTQLVLKGTIDDHPSTRCATTTLMNAFSSTPVNVYLFDNTGAAVGTSPMEYTANSDGSMTPPNGDNIYLPDNITGVDVYAVYPIVSTNTTALAQNNGTITHTVQLDQRSDASYLASDLLFAKVHAPKTDAVGNIISKNLVFNHLMTKILVNITMKPKNIKLWGIEIANAYHTVTFTPSTYTFGYSLTGFTNSDKGDATATGRIIINKKSDSGDENLADADGKIENQIALIPPQRFGVDEIETNFIRIDTSAGVAWYPINGIVDFLPGCTYTLNLAVRTDAIGTISVVHDWELGFTDPIQGTVNL